MKERRQQAILSIIANQQIETQEDLLLALESQGLSTTQATISRDIKELALSKQIKNGVAVYAQGRATNQDNLTISGIISVMAVEFIVVIKTKPGLAMAVCATLDEMLLSGNAGTIAGDDTCIMIMTSATLAKKMVKELNAHKG